SRPIDSSQIVASALLPAVPPSLAVCRRFVERVVFVKRKGAGGKTAAATAAGAERASACGSAAA
ncbi:MAG: hypothetical protein WBL61_05760, partial [Bryobacteraceae bacterium]